MPTLQYILKVVKPDENGKVYLNDIQGLMHKNTPVIISDLPNIVELEEFIEEQGEYLPDEEEMAFAFQEIEMNSITATYFDRIFIKLASVIQSYYENNQKDFINQGFIEFLDKYDLDKHKDKLLEYFNPDEWTPEQDYDDLFQIDYYFNYIDSNITLNNEVIDNKEDIIDILQERTNELVFKELENIAYELNIPLNEKKIEKPKI